MFEPSRKMPKNTPQLGNCRNLTIVLNLGTDSVVAHLDSTLKKPKPGHTQEHIVQGTALVLHKGNQPWKLDRVWQSKEWQLCKCHFHLLPHLTAFLYTIIQSMFSVTADCLSLCKTACTADTIHSSCRQQHSDLIIQHKDVENLSKQPGPAKQAPWSYRAMLLLKDLTTGYSWGYEKEEALKATACMFFERKEQRGKESESTNGLDKLCSE